MATGIANAIIYVRGVDLLSKPIQRAAAQATAEVKRIQTANQGLAADRAKYEKIISNATRESSNMAKSGFLQQKGYATQLKSLQNQKVDLVVKQISLTDKLVKTPIGTEKWKQLNYQLLSTNNKIDVASDKIKNLGKTAKFAKELANEKFGIKIDEIGNAQAGIKTVDILRKIGKESEAIALTNQRFRNLRATIQGVQSQLSTMGLTLSATLTAAVVSAGAAVVKTFADFDKSLRNIQSIGQQTDAQMSTLSNTFTKLSSDIKSTTSTPTQLAEAFYEIQSAGFYGADAMKILTQSTKTASAGLADQISTTKAVAMALHAYGVSTEEVGHYTDVMMRAVDIGIFRFEDLTAQMGDFIAAAGMMGVPIEEVLAALTAMTKKGLPIAEAATSLNRIMMNYLKPAKSEIALAKEYGIELSVNTLRTKGFAGAMTEMMEKTKGNEDVLANLIGEVRGIRGVFALGSDGLKMYNADLEALYNSAGTVDRVFATQTRSLSAKFQNLKNNISVLGISFGELLMPFIDKTITKVKDFVTSLNSMDSASKNSKIALLGIVAAIGPVMLALSGMAFGLNQIIGLMHTIITIGPKLASLFSGISGLFAALPILPFAIAAAGIALLVGGITMLIKRSREVTPMMQDLIDANKEIEKTSNDAALAIKNYYSELNFGGESFASASKKRMEEALRLQSDALRSAENLQRQNRASVLNANARIAADKFANATINLTNAQLSNDAAKKNAAQTAYDAARAEYDYAIALANSANTLLTVDRQLELHRQAMKNSIGVTPLKFDFLDLQGPFSAKPLVSITPVVESIDYSEIESAIAGLVGMMPVNILMGMESKYKKQLENFIKSINKIPGITDREKELRISEFLLSVTKQTDGIADSFDNAGKAAEDAAKKAEQAFADAVSTIKGYIEEGVNFSKNLGNSGDLGPLAPGANGPFEDIYRINDIAMSKIRGKGPDTDKYIQMFNNMSVETAMEIKKLFEKGLWYHPMVLPYIDTDKLKEYYQSQIAESANGEDALSGLAKDWGIPAAELKKLVTGDTANVAAAASGAVADMGTAINTAMKGTDVAGSMMGFGKVIWGSVEDEILLASQSSTVFQQAIANAVMAYQNNSQPTGINLPRNQQTGAVGRVQTPANITVTIQSGAVQVKSDDPVKVGNAVINALIGALNTAESQIGVTPPRLIAGGR